MKNRKYFQILAGTMMILLFVSVFCLQAAAKEIKVGVIFDYMRFMPTPRARWKWPSTKRSDCSIRKMWIC
jgi:hypothetical protein